MPKVPEAKDRKKFMLQNTEIQWAPWESAAEEVESS